MADNKNVISNGLTASKMRNRMEDKNTLAQKGSMYAGTGVMGENGAAVTTFTPPPSENTLLVKDDTQEGGLGWKNVGNVIGGALNARQNIMSNYIYTDQNSIFISHRTDPERNYTMSVNSRTFYGTGPAPSIIPCSKFVFYNGDGAGTKTDIEAKNFIGNLTGNADSATNVGDVTNKDEGDNAVVSFSIGNKTFNKTINNVKNANQATYTASNTRETIESRLTRLGFKQAQFPLYNAGSIRLKKLGNFVICDEVINRALGGGLSNLDNATLFTITNNDFIPIQAKTFSFWAADGNNQRVAYGMARINPSTSDEPGKCIVTTSRTLFVGSAVLQYISFSFGYDVTSGIY